jgi:protein-disulfide isomerase
MPVIDELYVADGTARLEIRPIAILGEESVQAAAAAQCANEQGAFWAYHDMLYANQGSERGGAFSDDRLKTFAGMLGLEAGAFNSCLDSDRYRTTVLDATTEAQLAGVGSTPTILVNGQEVETSVDAISTAVQRANEP